MKQRLVNPPYNLNARIAGRDVPIAQIVEQAAERDLPIHFRSLPTTNEDPALIDLSLAAEGEIRLDTPPQPGLGYAGLSAWQRRSFLDWLNDPTRAAPATFQQRLQMHGKATSSFIVRRCSDSGCAGTEPLWRAGLRSRLHRST
jgi:hypothetical protein